MNRCYVDVAQSKENPLFAFHLRDILVANKIKLKLANENPLATANINFFFFFTRTKMHTGQSPTRCTDNTNKHTSIINMVQS